MTKPLLPLPDPQRVTTYKELIAEYAPGGRAIAAAWDEQPWTLLFTNDETPLSHLCEDIVTIYPHIPLPIINADEDVRAHARVVPIFAAQMLAFTEDEHSDLYIYLAGGEWPHYPTRDELISELATAFGGRYLTCRDDPDPRVVHALTQLLDLLGTEAFTVIDEHLFDQVILPDDAGPQWVPAYQDSVAQMLTNLAAAYRGAHA